MANLTFRNPGPTAPGSTTYKSAELTIAEVDGNFKSIDDAITAFNGSNITSGTVAPARLGSGTPDSTKTLRGDGAWAVSFTGADISNDSSTNANTFYPTLSPAATTGKLAAVTVSSSKLFFNPNTGTLTATQLAGAGGSITALNATQLTSGTVPVARLGASGTPSTTTYLRGDNAWVAPFGGAIITNDVATDASTFYPTMSANQTGSALTTVTVSSTKLYFNPSSGSLNATNFNSLSDVTLKENIHTIPNAVDVVSQLNGVSYTWKDSGKKSYGVIAQELQAILPDLVEGTDTLSVNYSGLIAFLINAVQELDSRLKVLESM